MRRAALGSTVRDFAQTQHAASAVEFAVIFPALVILTMLGLQMIFYINAVRKVEQLAASISEMITQAVPPNVATTVATVNAQDLHFSYDSGLVIFPFLMKDAATQNVAWWQDIYIDYASIQFTPIASSNCTGKPDLSTCYTPKVVWTSTGVTGPNYRACGSTQSAAANTAPPSRTTLPAGVFGPNSLIVVDIVFTFHPTFGSNFIGPLRIARSTYTQPRYASLINYSLVNSDGIATICP